MWSTSDAGTVVSSRAPSHLASGIISIATIQITICTLSFNHQDWRQRTTTTMSARKNIHIGVFIPAPRGAQLLDTACIDVFGIASYEYLSELPILPKDLSSVAPEVKISYIGSQKSGEILKCQCLGLLNTIPPPSLMAPQRLRWRQCIPLDLPLPLSSTLLLSTWCLAEAILTILAPNVNPQDLVTNP